MAVLAPVIIFPSKREGKQTKGKRAVPLKQIWSFLSGKQKFFHSHKGDRKRRQDYEESLRPIWVFHLLPALKTKLESSY